MKNWLLIIFGALLFALIIFLFGDNRKERLRKKIKALQDERKEVWRETRQKEYLRNRLNKKLVVQTRLTSIAMLSVFMIASVATCLWSSGEINLSALFIWGGVVNLAILAVSQLYVHQPHQITYYLRQIQPFLRGKIFANHPKLDEEIEDGHKRVAIIDIQIQRLQRMIAA